MSEAAKCATVATAEVDLGWVTIKGHKTEQAVSAGVMGSCVNWQYDLNCCVIQIIRYKHSVEWSAFSKNKNEDMHVRAGVRPVSGTSQAEIKEAAVEALFGHGPFARSVLLAISICDDEHNENYGDMTMSLGGYFEPFPVKRKQVMS